MELKKYKVLIIKIGYSETLNPEISDVTSFGDVLRTTVLLNLYKDAHVTWLVDERAHPILKYNPYINRILIYNLTSVLQLKLEHFDVVINLEKVPGICALADQIVGWRRYGFRFDVKTGEAEACEGTETALSVCQDGEKKKAHNKYWQEHLFEMVGSKWKGEEYLFGYKSKSKVQYDIGLNYQVGNKWPTKAWPLGYWKEFEKLIAGEYSISWQEGLDDMEKYFDWIHSCRVIVTNDSFGLHLAIAMKKMVIALFSSTNASETYLYNRGMAIVPRNSGCIDIPCYAPSCAYRGGPCVNTVMPEEVYSEVRNILKSETRVIDYKETAG